MTCCYCYFRISWYSYETKLKLFTDITLLNDIDVDEAMDKVDPKLLKSISLMERKLLRISFVSALAFMAAWIPFATLCLWEMATPPTQIPTRKFTVFENHRKSLIQHCDRSEQRLHFEWTKVSLGALGFDYN